MKIKILILTILCSLCFIASQAQWKQVFNNSKVDGMFPLFAYEHTVFASTYNGIFLSKDSGTTWKSIDSPSNGLLALKFFVKDSIFYCQGNYAQLFKSSDTGRTWHYVGGFSKYCLINDVVVFGKSIFLASDRYNVLVSKDNGMHWDTSNFGLPPVSMSFIQGDFARIDTLGHKLFAFYYHGYIYSSNDSGKSWHFLVQAAPGDGAIAHIGKNIYLGESKTNNVNDIAVSSDSGNNWHTLFKPYYSNHVTSDIISDGKILLASILREGIVFSNDSGKNWIYINDGLIDSMIYNIVISDGYVYCGTQKSVFRRSLSKITGDDKISNNSLSEVSILKVYPNPLKHSTTFEFGRELENGKIIIYNMIGQQVQSLENIHTDKAILHCNGLASGTYLYILSEKGKKLATGKLIME